MPLVASRCQWLQADNPVDPKCQWLPWFKPRSQTNLNEKKKNEASVYASRQMTGTVRLNDVHWHEWIQEEAWKNRNMLRKETHGFFTSPVSPV